LDVVAHCQCGNVDARFHLDVAAFCDIDAESGGAEPPHEMNRNVRGTEPPHEMTEK